MNVRDSELVGGILMQADCDLVDSVEQAEVILLNTCAVRENAQQRVIGRINQLSALKKNYCRTIGVLGCVPQHLGEELLDAVPAIDFILGPDSYRSLPEILDSSLDTRYALCRLDRTELYEGLPHYRTEGSPSAFVTVMRGCNRMCTFCVVPHTRGRERSRRAGDITAEVERLIEEGVKEVILLGQTVNAYRDGETLFAELLWKVAETGIPRIRFTSPHPSFFREEELEAVAECDAVCEWVHLPVQAGSSEVLERMKRGYTREEYIEIARRIRQRIPHVALTTDIIVGFPGESEEQFEETLSLMEECVFDSSYHFKYSPRPGTYADRNFEDDVDGEVKQRRLERVIELQNELTASSNRKFESRSVEILVTERGGRGSDQWQGRTRENKIVIVESKEDLLGAMVDVNITGTGTWSLRGELKR
jgi:tRNA-2-methylthio-N6-dimethylallyladenosine synthase